MASSPAQKLKIREGFQLLALHAPKEFEKTLAPLPPGVKIASSKKNFNQVHWFVMNKVQMERELEEVVKFVKGEVILWIYYPKGSSKHQTDLTRDKGWEKLLRHEELTWISLVSFDETWSAFGCREKMEKDLIREASPRERPVFDFVDPKTKSITLPADLAAAFKKNKKQQDFFDTLSFTNKKEYVEWIVSAKKEETRTQRVAGTIEKLGMNWKNPNNR